jgi:hypothetical protein
MHPPPRKLKEPITALYVPVGSCQAKNGYKGNKEKDETKN